MDGTVTQGTVRKNNFFQLRALMNAVGTIVVALLALAAPPLAHASDRAERAGDVLALGLPLLAAGLSLNEGDTGGFWQLARSEALTVGSILVLKEVVHSTRPNGRDDKSFPSGHSGIAFAAAHHIQLKHGASWGLPAYAMAGLVAWSRVDAREHRWRDVIAGGAIGVLSTAWLSAQDTRIGRSAEELRRTRWALLPDARGGVHLTAAGRF